MSRPHEVVDCQYDNDRAVCSCGLIDRVLIVRRHIWTLEGGVVLMPDDQSDEHIYPQGTPESAVEPEGASHDEAVLWAERLAAPLALRLRKVAQAYPYALAVMALCQTCQSLLSLDHPTEGAGLDLLVMTHAMHRLAGRGIDPYENPQEEVA